MKTLYELTLPHCDRHGNSLAEAHNAFHRFALRSYGNCTIQDVLTSWLADSEGNVETAQARVYRVAADYGQSDIAAGAQHYFPDIDQFWVSNLGTVEVIAQGHRPAGVPFINKEAA